jgi:hypothetical protein
VAALAKVVADVAVTAEPVTTQPVATVAAVTAVAAIAMPAQRPTCQRRRVRVVVTVGVATAARGPGRRAVLAHGHRRVISATTQVPEVLASTVALAPQPAQVLLRISPPNPPHAHHKSQPGWVCCSTFWT